MTLRRLGIIGCGGIAGLVLTTLAQELPAPLVQLSLLVRPQSVDRARALLESIEGTIADAHGVHTDLAAFLADNPDVVAECASHVAVRDYAPSVLESGRDLIVISIGALADDSLRRRLAEAAQTGGARVVLPAGAIGGVDALAAARLSGLESVVYTGRKPPKAWRGTPAEQRLPLETLSEPAIFFEGSARKAAEVYPFNANVAATLALAGIGMDATKVRLVADPGITRNVHEFTVTSRCSDFTVRLEGRASPDNPKTSLLTGYSIARELLNRAGPWVI